jgi:alpha-amylase
VKLSEGAGIAGWDLRAARHALGAVMRRRPEAYHARLRLHEAAGNGAAEGGTGNGDAGGRGDGGTGDRGAPASIHDVVASKETGLAERLHYDWHERRSGLVHLFPPDTSAEAILTAAARELGDFVDRPFRVEELAADRLVVVRDGSVEAAGGAGERLPVTVEKTLIPGGDRRAPFLRLEVGIENRSALPIDALLAIEWDTTLLGGGANPAAWYVVDGERTPHDATGSAASGTTIRTGNDDIGVAVATAAEPAAAAIWGPIETVSNSEAGFERVYQGSQLFLTWPLRLAPGERQHVSVEHHIAISRDRAAEEAAAAAPA